MPVVILHPSLKQSFPNTHMTQSRQGDIPFATSLCKPPLQADRYVHCNKIPTDKLFQQLELTVSLATNVDLQSIAKNVLQMETDHETLPIEITKTLLNKWPTGCPNWTQPVSTDTRLS